MIQLRKVKGYSVEQTARLAGLLSTTLRCYEKGLTRNPSVTVLEKFCNVIGISLSDFFLGMEAPDEPESPRTNDESGEDIIRRINLLPSNLRNQAYLHLEFLEHLNNPAKEKEAVKASDCE